MENIGYWESKIGIVWKKRDLDGLGMFVLSAIEVSA